MKAYERLAEAFAAEGVVAVFGMMGEGNEDFMNALDRKRVAIYEVRHEGAGLGMADGWARVGRDVGVVCATQGPGLSQLATALLTASRASSPIVAFVGEHGARETGHHQYLDQSRFAQACEAAFVRVGAAENVDSAVREAFYIARTQHRPVVLSAPVDVQNADMDYAESYVPTLELLPDLVVEPLARQVAAAADLVVDSQHPVVVVGRGARWSGAGDSVLALADRIGALVGTTLMAMTWLAEDEFHIGISGGYTPKASKELLAQADLVIGIGASLNKHTVQPGRLYPKAKFVHLDERPHVPISDGRSADAYVRADCRLGVDALLGELVSRGFSNEGYRVPEVKQRLVDKHVDGTEFTLESDDILDPRAVVSTLDEVIPGDIPLATGSGAQAGFSTMGFAKPRPYVLGATFYGCIGQMMPAVMGAAALTGEPIFLVDGDASVMMHLAEFETAVRYGWPVLIVVQNNEALGSEYYSLQRKNFNTDLALISCPDLGQIAVAMGGSGRLVRSVDELTAAAKAWVENPGPTIIDARVSREVISIVMRRKLGFDV